ncbi:Hypothetical protein NTJ_08207 [Nesidiocoris tenuis]|uniref:Uncharacterized protein n=1 Tax=Nesidiocoris tenuis TaxID=355587 RepID=A0ABN7AT63_9HEMI|nr:Hypothetical protein NTJ_08207 [Nesidiocoris tenuis]
MGKFCNADLDHLSSLWKESQPFLTISNLGEDKYLRFQLSGSLVDSRALEQAEVFEQPEGSASSEDSTCNNELAAERSKVLMLLSY